MSYGDDYEGNGPRRTANAPPPLRVRKPTGNIGYPLVLVEGEPKGGKSFALAALSASPRVGRTFVLELGERNLDEYASLGPFELIEHNGTFSDMRGQVNAALAVPQQDGRPNVFGLDTSTALWDLLKDWVDSRAKRSAKARKILETDPDAEIDSPMNLWNDAKDRWHSIIDALMAWDGIAVVIARSGEVAKVVGGRPVEGETVYKVDAEKTLPFDCTAQVRFLRGQKPRLMAVQSLFLEVPAAGLELPREATLDYLVFDVLSGGRPFSPSTLTLPQIGVPVAAAKARVLSAVQRAHPTFSDSEAKADAARLWAVAVEGTPTEVTEAKVIEILAHVGESAPGTESVNIDGNGANIGESASGTEGRQLPPGDVIARVRAMGKPELVDQLAKADLATGGSLTAMQDRLIEHLGLSEAPMADAEGRDVM